MQHITYVMFSYIKELTGTHEPIQEIMMVFLISERRTTMLCSVTCTVYVTCHFTYVALCYVAYIMLGYICNIMLHLYVMPF